MAVTTTAQTIIVGALKLIGALAQGEAPSAPVLQDSFARLNSLIDSWQTQPLTMLVTVREEFALVADQHTYTLGVDGEWDMARPASIDAINLILNDSSPATEIPLVPLTNQAWESLQVKDLENPLPTQYYVEWTTPLAEVRLWPVPTDATNTIALYAPLPTAQFTTYTASTVLPPGYERAIRYNLAVDLAPEMGVPTPTQVAIIAREELSRMKANNTPMADLTLDPGLTYQERRSGYNIRTDA